MADEAPTAQSSIIASFPKKVFLLMAYSNIVSFAEYGLASVLSIYMKKGLKYDEETAIELYHTFKIVECCVPLIGAILADSLIGKFWTLIMGSIFLHFGFLFTSISSINVKGMPQRDLFLCGVIFLAIGSGTIRSSHGPFVTDQFQLKEHITLYFTLFFYLNNIVVFCSMIVIPYMEQMTDCFDDEGCYPLPFFVCTVIHMLGIVLVLLGKKRFNMKIPVKNLYWQCLKCLLTACLNKAKHRKGGKKQHWLDHAGNKYDSQLIDDIKAILSVVLLILPNICYWALYDQQGSTWTFQATRMDGTLGNLQISPSQMQSTNPLLIIILLPICQFLIFPFLEKHKLMTRPLQRMSVGGLLMATSFVVAATVETCIEKSYPELPLQGEGEVRFYNSLRESLTFNSGWAGEFRVPPLNFVAFKHIPVDDTEKAAFNVTSGSENMLSGTIYVTEGQSLSYLAMTESETTVIKPLEDYDIIYKDITGKPIVQIICSYKCTNGVLTLTDEENENTELWLNNMTATTTLSYPSRYKIFFNGINVLTDIYLRNGGIYSILIYNAEGTYGAKVFTTTKPNSVNMLWQIPQYILLTSAEILFAISSKYFIYSQAPLNMRSLIAAVWALGNAFGDLLITLLVQFEHLRKVYEFLMYAAILYGGMIIFIWLAHRYKWREWIDQ